MCTLLLIITVSHTASMATIIIALADLCLHARAISFIPRHQKYAAAISKNTFAIKMRPKNVILFQKLHANSLNGLRRVAESETRDDIFYATFEQYNFREYNWLTT